VVGKPKFSRRVTRRRGEAERLLPDCLFPRFNHGTKIGVHYWICFTARAKGPLFIWDRVAYGNYTAANYQRHIIPLLTQFVHQQEALFSPHTVIQDNAPSHSARTTQERFQQLGITLESHPPSSPDLNCAENVIGSIKHRVETQQRYCTTRGAVREAIRNAYDSIPQEWIKECVNSMPRRIRAVLDAQGGPTRY
jgi:hypothetical protein